ncbi:MAG: AAA family ATPase [Planctomycetota bacterium]
MIDTSRIGLGKFQAARRLLGLRKKPQEPLTTTARVVCVASGKGGTGKSIVATNLAVLRAQMGERVLLIDFDAGLANDHLLLGVAPTHDLGHVLRGEVHALEALVEAPAGIKLLSGGVGRDFLANPTRRDLEKLYRALLPLESGFDLIVLDHGAGLGFSTVANLAAATTLLLVTQPEVTALSDSYAVYKRASLLNPYVQTGLLVNRSLDEHAALGAWERFKGASQRFLGHSPDWIGWVPADRAVQLSVDRRLPVVLDAPDCPAARALHGVSRWAPLEHARGARPFFERARASLR